MFDIGWSELLVMGALALIVVGPKDLPRALRSAGQFVGKMRGMAREFQRSMNEAARDADLADMKELKGLQSDLRNIQSDFRKQVSGSAALANRPGTGAKDTPKDAPAKGAATGTADDMPAGDTAAAGGAAAEAPAKPAPAKRATAKRATAKPATAKAATGSGAAKTGTANTGPARSGPPKPRAAKPKRAATPKAAPTPAPEGKS